MDKQMANQKVPVSLSLSLSKFRGRPVGVGAQVVVAPSKVAHGVSIQKDFAISRRGSC